MLTSVTIPVGVKMVQNVKKRHIRAVHLEDSPLEESILCGFAAARIKPKCGQRKRRSIDEPKRKCN